MRGIKKKGKNRNKKKEGNKFKHIISTVKKKKKKHEINSKQYSTFC